MSEYPLDLTFRNSAGGDLETARANTAADALTILVTWVEVLGPGDSIVAQEVDA